MTVEDAFDARLKAAFADAQPEATEEFVARVAERLGAPNRRRILIIGGAGAGGSTVASTQLEGLYGQFGGAVDDVAASSAASGLGDYAFLANVLQPETLAAMTLAVMVAAFAFFLPSRN
jgi:hypothetical protein